MNIQDSFTQFTAWFSKTTTAQKFAFFSAAGLAIAVILVSLMWALAPKYQYLFTNLDESDASLIVQSLKENRIPYKLVKGGTALMIPEGSVYETRLNLASQGLPKGGRGDGFALFDSREALQKSFLRQTALTEQLQETNAALEVARRSEEEAKNFRGQFLANMSHELRTPLNAIIGFSQTMLDFPAMYDGVELPAQYRQDMNQVLTSGKHLLTIINDILDLSKVDAGKLDLEIQPVDLHPIVKGVLSTAVGLVGDKGAQIKLLHDVPDPLPMVLGDPLRVRQVLLNLYSNAAKFTDSGYIKLIVAVEGDEVVFGVEDTGIGIAESDKITIFEEFRQGTAGRRKGRQGAGLGLPISQELLRLMNGRLWFESVLGKGSLFCFALPLVVPDADNPAADEMIAETAG